MPALQLDYQRACRPVPWLGLAVLVFASAALFLLGGYYRTLDRQLAFWEARLERSEGSSTHRSQASPALSGQAAREQLLEVKHANQVVRQLSLPWNALFKAVETSSGKEIALLSLEPDPGKGTVTISGEAKDFDALLDYARQLSACGMFDTVMLQSHQIQQAEPEKPLRFSLLAKWSGVPL